MKVCHFEMSMSTIFNIMIVVRTMQSDQDGFSEQKVQIHAND